MNEVEHLIPFPAFPLPAFPGAEGHGTGTAAGRLGSLGVVTTLASSGEGSLQWAVDQPGARFVIFAVEGNILGGPYA